jgi:hypothetical protein
VYFAGETPALRCKPALLQLFAARIGGCGGSGILRVRGVADAPEQAGDAHEQSPDHRPDSQRNRLQVVPHLAHQIE